MIFPTSQNFKASPHTVSKNIIGISLVFYLLYVRYLYVVFMIKYTKKVDNILSKHPGGYRKGYSAERFLISVFEKWRGNLDKGGMWSFICKLT